MRKLLTSISLLALPASAWAIAPAGLSDPATLLAGVPTSGAITMMPGETYQGPGPLTVGYLGAKKQIVLPNGPWVLLAVADRKSSHATPQPLVSMAFGQFREGRLTSLVSYLFNGRAGQAALGWSDAEGCLTGNPPAGGEKVQVSEGRFRACGWTVRQTRPPNVTDEAWLKAPVVAAQLGAKVSAAPLQFTRAWVLDGGSNYLAIRRADYGLAASTTAQPQRMVWLREYLPFMLEGLDKRIGATELEPDQTQPPRVRITLPD